MSIPKRSKPKQTLKSVQILHLEDNKLDRELIQVMLEDSGLVCRITAVETRQDYVKQIAKKEWDVILSDYSLPAFDGFEALKIAAKDCPNTPFLFVTGTLGEDIAVESIKGGATDYVLKHSLMRLPTAVRRALNERELHRKREEAEAERDRSEQRLHFLAYHDALTNLPNRTMLLDRLEQLLFDAIRRNEKIALLFIDLDRFKDVNDSLGHSAGDLLLQQFADRLKNCTRANDTVARLGGDEFVVIVPGIKNSLDAVISVERIKTAISKDFLVNGISFSATCSVGISVFPDDGTNADALLKGADIALFSAKDAGRNGWRFFTKEMNGQALQRLRMETALRRAITDDQLYLEYQPQLELSTGRVIGAEALLRWRHPEMGLIPPNTFIPIAENIGEIIPIGEWVLRTACSQAMKWQQEGLPPFVVSVNVSVVQLRQGSLPATINRVLAETGLAPQYLELEITESLLLARCEEINGQMKTLAETGLRLSLDDFGTGYSSFSYMSRFRFDRLKIDGSFVRTLGADPRTSEITASIIGVGTILNMEVIAECVETQEQLNLLRSFGCDQIQGYYFSPPISPAALSDKIQSQPERMETAISLTHT